MPNLLDDFVSKSKFKPNNAQSIRYLFFTMGIGSKEFNETPLPYIFEIISTHGYVKDQEEKAAKKRKNG